MRRPLTLLSNKALFMSLFWPAISPMGRKVNFSCLAKSACKTSVSVKEHVIKLSLPLRDPFRSGLSTYYSSFIWAANHSAAPIIAIMCTPLTSHDLPALLIERIAALHFGAGVWTEIMALRVAHWCNSGPCCLSAAAPTPSSCFSKLLIGRIVWGYLSSSFSPVIK